MTQPASALDRELAIEQAHVDLVYAQLDKATWLASCRGRGELTVTARVYAFDASVRCAFLDAQRGFFNGTGLCLRVEGREAEPQRLQLGTLPRG